MMLEIDSLKSLLSMVHREKEIYLYGGGIIAKEILYKLPKDDRLGIKAILVSHTDENAVEIAGIPVKGIDAAGCDRKAAILIATGKKYQEEIRNLLTERGYERIACVSEEYETEINIGRAERHGYAEMKAGLAELTKVKAEVARMKSELAKAKVELGELKKGIRRLTPRPRLKMLVVNILYHCNLNCRGCDHFSPIAGEEFHSREQIEEDLRQIRNILGDAVDNIAIEGGEPLLHPELPEILEMCRNVFPEVNIGLYTNGIMLLNQQEEFWECCFRNKIVLEITKYPIKLDYDRICQTAKDKKVECRYYSGGTTVKTMGHYPLDLSGSQNPMESFLHCFHANNECNMLDKGRLYTCTVAPTLPIFCRKFGIDVPLTADDGIDIYSVSGKKELLELLSRPMQVCRYCDTLHRTFGHTWGQSKGEMEEWT